MKKSGTKIIATNKKARHEYFIEDTMEAGIVLTGTEVKSIRQGKVNIKDSYATIENGEVYLHNMHISPYEQGNIYNVDPLRKRKLLLHKREIRKLYGGIQLQGYTLVPLSLYLKDGRVKVELATAKGKKLYDKREAIAKKDAERRIKQHSSEKYRG
jgi:SsrA-binding protein